MRKSKSANKREKPKLNLRKKSHILKETHVSLASQNILRELGRIVAGAYYDHQQVRIQGVNRVRDIIRKRVEGIKFDEVEQKKPDEEKYKEKFKDSEIPDLLNKLKDDDKITQKEFDYIHRMMEVHKNAEKYEKEYKKLMMEFVEGEEIYQKFLKHVRGISAVLSANLIKEFGYCENAQHISSLWKYCGMHVVDGEAPKRKKGVKLDFNLRLRTLVWKIGDSFIKQRTPFYRDIYDKEKARQLKIMEDNEPSQKRKPKEVSVSKNKMHCHLRAQRMMAKIFLAHYWMCCKEISEPVKARKPLALSEPLSKRNPFTHSEPIKMRKPVLNSEPLRRRNPFIQSEQPYASAKLGHKHISSWREAIK